MTLAAVAMAMALVACGGARPKPPASLAPAERCAPTAPATILSVGFSKARLAELVASAREGLVVVADACGEPRVLPACHAKGRYAPIGVAPRETRVDLASADELRWNAPSSGDPSAASAPLGLDLAIAGRRVASRAGVQRDELEGECGGATHFVRAIDLGIAARTGRASKEPAAIPAACAIDGDAESPPLPRPGCDDPVRLHLVPIGATVDATLARAEPSIACAPGTVLSDHRCTANARAPRHACRFGDAADCDAQCEHGDASSCATLGWMLLTGRSIDADLARGFELSRRACALDEAKACGNAAAALENAAEDDDDVEATIGLLQTGCDLGDAWSCVELGRYLARLDGADADLDLLRRLFERGCDAGDPSGCAELGITFAPGTAAPDREREVVAHERGCEGGDATSCTNLGVLHLRGEGVPRDVVRARTLLQRGCDGGLALGCADLGLLYETGEGGAQDSAKAAELFGDACVRGSTLGCRQLALMREKALGGPRDLDRAAGLYAKACELHDALACGELARMHLEGTGILKDEHRAAELFDEACQAGIALSCYNLGLLYDEGRGVPKNADKALASHRHACDGGYQPSCRRIGRDAK